MRCCFINRLHQHCSLRSAGESAGDHGATASVFVSHMDHMLASSLQGSSDLCQNKLCYLCSRTHSMRKGQGAVPGGAAVRRRAPRTLTSCPTLRTYTDGGEKISVCFNVRLPLTLHGSRIALISSCKPLKENVFQA